MRVPIALPLGLVASLLAGSSARAEGGFLSVGRFSEEGQAVQGHGALLRANLAWELTDSGAFKKVADKSASKEIAKKIKETNTPLTDDQHWIDIGRAVGATHLLLGDVKSTAAGCVASAELIHLATRKSKPSTGILYRCRASDLKEVAGQLAVALVGKRASKPSELPIEIVMGQDSGSVDGKPVHFGTTAPKPPPRTPPEAPALDPNPPEQPQHSPPTEGQVDAAPPRFSRGTSEPDAMRDWAGFARGHDELYTLRMLAEDVRRQRAHVISAVLAVPFLLVVAGAIAIRFREEVAVKLLRGALSIATLLLSLELAVAAFYSTSLDRALQRDADPLLLASPVLATGVALIGGKLIGVFSDFRLLRQLGFLVLFVAFFVVVILVASQLRIHAGILGAVTVVFWVTLRLAGRARQRKRDRLLALGG